MRLESPSSVPFRCAPSGCLWAQEHALCERPRTVYQRKRSFSTGFIKRVVLISADVTQRSQDSPTSCGHNIADPFLTCFVKPFYYYYSILINLTLCLFSLPIKCGGFRFRLKGCNPLCLIDMGLYYPVDSGICSLFIRGSLTLSGGYI